MSLSTHFEDSLSDALHRVRALGARILKRGVEYDPVAAAVESREAIFRVMDCPQVDPGFKERVRRFADARRSDLAQLGNQEAASLYDLDAEHSSRAQTIPRQRSVTGW